MGYLEGTNEARTEHFAGEAEPDVSGREPHTLSGVKEWCRSEVSVGKAFLGIGGFPADAGEWSPIPAHYAETSRRQLGQSQALPPRETWRVGNQGHTETE